MECVVLAGAASLFGLENIRSSLRSLALEVLFIEAPFMKDYGKVDARKEALMRFTPVLPAGIPVIPLNEYWISQCLASGGSLAGKKALRASRSKLLLYQLLSSVSPVPRVFDRRQEALSFIRAGGDVVVKPDGLFSGYGVKVVGQDEADSLEHWLYNASHVTNNATKLFAVHNAAALMCERVLGEEGSADVFVCRGRVGVVRVCRKVVRTVHDVPCTQVCQLIDASAALVLSLNQWCALLFGKDEVAFAQFDFITTPAGSIVPVDFASRVGGGIEPLLGAWGQERGANPYAQAIRTIVGGVPLGAAGSDGLWWTQFNVLPTKSGRLCRDDYPMPEGRRHIFKRTGDFVPQCPCSAESRVASVVVRWGWPVDEQLLDDLLLGDEYIATSHR